MFASSTLTILLSAAVMASTHEGRKHADLAKRLDNNTFSLGKRDTYQNKEFTWYPTDTGPDACTGKNHQDSDYYVAMGYDQFGDGGCCGKQMRITVNGKSAVATCVDECASCPEYGQLDFTKGLFEFFTGGDLGVGEIFGSWSYVDGSDSGSGSGDEDTTTKKTTTKKAPTTTKQQPPPTPTTTSTKQKVEVKTTHKVTPVAVTTTHTTTKATSTSSSSSKKTTSSAKPSSSKASSAKPSSSAKAYSSAKAASTSAAPSAAAPPASTPTDDGVANAGADTGSSGGSSAGSSVGGAAAGGAAPVSGALGTGSDDSSDAASMSFNKLFAAVAVVALAAIQAL
ncbi:hypothetical protein C8F04DRAFT_410177 [Mycena alexandri]|uniref:Uncharacterized protein n=1 Tax=Mycena alexandri TaxID=1745969 RepID=A0AAD6T0Z5_9AGAR|nr:hypothetical protein C8F04DRAFT_410177 [Mycena alexandri]